MRGLGDEAARSVERPQLVAVSCARGWAVVTGTKGQIEVSNYGSAVDEKGPWGHVLRDTGYSG